MKPVITTLLVVCATFIISFAQKAKNEVVTFPIVSLPSEKLPSDFQTYSVSFSGSGLSTAGYTSQKCEDRIQMDGFKRLNGMDQYGHLRIRAYIGYIKTGENERKSKKHTSKDKETGKETVSYSYWYDIPYSVSISFRIYDPLGNILIEDEQIEKTVSQTTSYSSTSKLYENYRSQHSKLRAKFAKSTVDKLVERVQRTLSKKYDFNQTGIRVSMLSMKKHPAEAEFEKNIQLVKQNVVNLHDDKSPENLEKIRNTLKPAMDFWATQDNINPNDPSVKKKELKSLKAVYRAANTNMALLSFYVYDDFESAINYAQLVIDSEGKDRNSKLLINAIEASKTKMEVHGIPTLHHIRDVSNALAPSQVAELAEMKQEIEEDNNTQEATVVIDGESIKGSIVQAKDQEELIFGKDGQTKFMTEADGQLWEYDLTDEKISSFSIGNRQFVKERFSPCAKGKEEAQVHILEIIYDTDKIKLYKYYPSTGTLGDDKIEYAFQKLGEEFPISLHETQFLLWNKGIAKYFADCSDLNEMCSSGGIQQNKDDLIKAARIYAELCE